MFDEHGSENRSLESSNPFKVENTFGFAGGLMDLDGHAAAALAGTGIDVKPDTFERSSSIYTIFGAA